MLSARFPVPSPPSESAFLVVQVRPDDRPMSRHGASRRPVGHVLLELWWRGLTGPSSGRPLRPSGAAAALRPGCGPACQRITSAVVASASSSWSPLVLSLFVLSSSVRWPSAGSARYCTVCRAAPVSALLGPIAWCPRLSPARTMFIAPVVTSAAHGPVGPPVAPAVSVLSNGSQAVSRASRHYPNSCSTPEVSSADRQYPRLLTGLESRQRLEPASASCLGPVSGAYCTVVYESSRAG